MDQSNRNVNWNSNSWLQSNTRSFNPTPAKIAKKSPENWKTRGPGATSLTWVILANISININVNMIFLIAAPFDPRGTMVWKILNLHCIRKLPCKYDLFWLSGSVEEDVLMNPPHFCIFVIISPLKKTWPLIWTISNSLYRRMTYAKFDWNWPAGSREEDFFQYKHM